MIRRRRFASLASARTLPQALVPHADEVAG
jgi:hypothetical protein